MCSFRRLSTGEKVRSNYEVPTYEVCTEYFVHPVENGILHGHVHMYVPVHTQCKHLLLYQVIDTRPSFLAAAPNISIFILIAESKRRQNATKRASTDGSSRS